MSLSSTTPDAPAAPAMGGALFADRDALVLPAIPRAAERVPFPLIASAAPVIAACAIWAITQSPFVLLFAALGPVVAVASMLDGKRQTARRARHENTRFRAELQSVRTQLVRYHEVERAEAWASNPAALGSSDARLDSGPDGLWHNAGLTTITLGRGAVPSAVDLDVAALAGSTSGEQHTPTAIALAELKVLRTQARVLLDAPVLAHASGGVAIVGAPQLANAALRGLVVQIARASQPATVQLEVPADEEWAWAIALPQCGRQGGGAARAPATARAVIVVRIVDRAAGSAHERGTQRAHDDVMGATPPPVVLAVAESIEQVPPECATVLRLDSARSATIIRTPERGRHSSLGSELVPELVGREQAGAMAQRLARRAVQAGLTTREQSLPSAVSLHELPGYGTTSTGLNCVIGVAAHGTIELDLVAHGPHAVVGGTTGSGKSELLVSWVISMAGAHSPTEFSVLLVDFKGGAAFSGLEALPHCVGVLTDLDEHEATRAMASLRAELRAREEQLRAEGARAIDELGGAASMPRLVIVVDEFAAMLGSFPELHELFVDIAARGRSLGVHLVLCTQRPAGVVRDTLLANCSLRLSLRVNNAADSRATLGTDAAAHLPATLPGRALVDTGDGRVIEFHSAVADTARLVAEIGEKSVSVQTAAAGGTPRRPWLPPLPTEIRIGDPELALASPGEKSHGPATALEFTLGILDEPQRQRRVLALWLPETQGALLVLGAARTGRTTLLDVLHKQAEAHGLIVTRCSAASAEAYWDTLVRLGDPAPAGAGTDGRDAELNAPHRELVLLDEWEAVVARWPSEYQLAATELLANAVRASSARGVHIVLVANGMNGAIQSSRAQWDAVLLLRLTEKSEHLRAGGDAAHWVATSQAGRGEWQGLELQCALPATTLHAVSLAQADFDANGVPLDSVLAIDEGVLLVISTRPARALACIRARLAAASGRFKSTVFDLAEIGPGALPGSAGALPRSSHDGATAVPASEPLVIIGDPDAWQARWGLFTTLRPQARLAFDGCRLADYRAFSRQRELPPLIATSGAGAAAGQTRVWAIDLDGRVSRARLG